MPKQHNKKTSIEPKAVEQTLTQQEEVLRLYAHFLVRHAHTLKELQKQVSALMPPQQKEKDGDEL